MTQLFKYFPYHDRFAKFMEAENKCLHCRLIKKCIEVDSNERTNPLHRAIGNPLPEGICPECLSKGVLRSYGLIMNDFEYVNPRHVPLDEMRAFEPGFYDQDLRELYIKQCAEITYATPKVYFWQEDVFPYMDGDFGEFLGFASKQDYIELASGGDPKELYRKSSVLFPDDPYIDELWDYLPDEKVQSFEEGNYFHITSYLFRSLNTGRLLTLYDGN